MMRLGLVRGGLLPVVADTLDGAELLLLGDYPFHRGAVESVGQANGTDTSPCGSPLNNGRSLCWVLAYRCFQLLCPAAAAGRWR